MRFAVLGSGSKGNALVVEGGGRRVLVDCGYGPRELRRRLAHLGLDLKSIDALLLTHGHGDHIKGARQVAGALGIPTFTTQGTARFCVAFGGLRNVFPIVAGQRFSVGGLEVLPVATPHDAPGSVCFVLDDGNERLGVCTDLGVPTDDVAHALRTCQALVLEFNHDPDMLQRGPYTPALKRRIASPRGHLSNEAGATLLAQARHDGLGRVLLAHLSEVNNTPDLALRAARPAVDGADVELGIAPQHHPTGWLRVRRQRALAMDVELVTEEPVVGAAGIGAAGIGAAGIGAAPSFPPEPASVVVDDAGDPAPVGPASAIVAPPPRNDASSPRHVALERHLALFAASPPSSSSRTQ